MKLKFRYTILGITIVCLVALLFVGCGEDENAQTKAIIKDDTKLIIEYPESHNESLDNFAVENVGTKNEDKTDNSSTNESIVKNKKAFYLSDYERKVVESIVMGEAEGEPYDGQVLVAQCILNACLKDDIQPSEVRKKYKYSGWSDNPSESVKKAVSAVFDDGYKVTDEFVLYFYAKKYASGTWHETQCFVVEIGGHRFFSEWD